jgi:diguanylate cyclase (GGDEF)-like protein/PAS domain S-box-containing protein/putative nucleotidyltransferase with HDIG domain
VSEPGKMVQADLGWLHDVGRLLAKAQSRPEIFAVAYHGLQADRGYDRVAISLFDREAGLFECCVRTDAQGAMLRPEERFTGLTQESALWRFPCLAALLGGEAFYHTFDATARCPAGLRYLFGGVPSHYLAVPLRVGPRVIGMIAVDNLFSGHPILPAAADLLLVLAGQIDMALANVCLSERWQDEYSRRSAAGERLRALYATMACGVMVRDADGLVVDANAAAQEILGRPLEYLRGLPLSDTLVQTMREDGTPLPPEDRPVALALRTGLPQRGYVMAATVGDGQRRWLQVDAVPMVDASGKPGDVVISFVDITARKQAEDTLRRSETRLAVLLESARALNSSLNRDHILQELAMLLTTALNARGASFTHVNFATRIVTSLAHYSAPGRPAIFTGAIETLDHFPVLEEVLRTHTMFHGCIDDPDFPESERAYLRRWDMKAELLAPLVVHGVASGVLDIYWDQPTPVGKETMALCTAIAEQAAVALEHAGLYADAAKRAERDALTGLANHRSLLNRIDTSIAVGAPFAFLLLDVDNFKLFNDSYGHPVGDRVLTQVAEIMRDVSRQDDLAARYGGDEFALLLRGSSLDEAQAVADRLCSAIRARPQTTPDGAIIPLTLSVGLACFPVDGQTRPELLAVADQAMYTAKRGTGRAWPRYAADLLGDSPFGVLEGLVNAVDAKDRYTREHSEDVTQRALLLARALGVSEKEQRILAVAGPLHDVGKVAVPDRILRKPSRLTEEELAVIKQHVAYGVAIIRGVLDDADVVAAVAHHHERWDGTGYPSGIPGPATPLVGRIMQVADAVSAMMMDRPYRRGLTWDTVVGALRAGAGTQFDPDLVEVFIAASGRLAIAS